MRKSLKVIGSVVLFVFMFSTIASAVDLSTIGYIDVQAVFKGFNETASAQEELSKKEEVFKKAFEDSQKKLEQANKEGKSEKEIEALREKLEKDLAPKRDELLRLNEKLTTKLQLEILSAVKTVAKKVGIEVVFDKQVIITGGMDLTDMTIAELNR
ncbi:MAG: OmpH family outer membrane protein [Candidatus Margulisbacteria bacterium]|nr:OmpH family outer membrane protein [Candidatus Margulisiibacteriota bacterium]MBU1021962.1 OmpH family outer membrane protein [Candidatus Margulisiibacteriota bacterium]MBU1728941.1 OmpH family outer membrane protein [Candidatus Margulisiibacteriota bacterium]MBU1954747.1 OmpH family outer membrane protein [Candidatus Margulisiibacteriota bacterium]